MPVWFMRQAGRSLPEYRAMRGSGSILDAIAQPEIACEATLQPVRRYGVDAAILFSDIVVPVHAVGFGVDVVQGRGPVVEEPFRTKADLARLRDLELSDIEYVTDTCRMVTSELDGTGTPLIGFAGAPFTVASYLVEGGPSRTFVEVKGFAHREPALFLELCDRLADLSIAFISAQVAAGASAIQLFDSWAGALAPSQYERFALPSTRRIMSALAPLGVPRILYGLGTGELLALMATSGADVIGVDWHVPIDVARARVGALAVQGNLDPALCVDDHDVALDAARDVLARSGERPGHIFNLGHGVLPMTDPGVLADVVDVVHEEGRAGVEVAP
jgi:uroporphyrinogen decarboxylase